MIVCPMCKGPVGLGSNGMRRSSLSLILAIHLLPRGANVGRASFYQFFFRSVGASFAFFDYSLIFFVFLNFFFTSGSVTISFPRIFVRRLGYIFLTYK